MIAVGHFRPTRAAIAATETHFPDADAVELMDRTIIDLSRQKNEYPALDRFCTVDPDALLFVTFFGETQDAAERAGGPGPAWQPTVMATTRCARSARPIAPRC